MIKQPIEHKAKSSEHYTRGLLGIVEVPQTSTFRPDVIHDLNQSKKYTRVGDEYEEEAVDDIIEAESMNDFLKDNK